MANSTNNRKKDSNSSLKANVDYKSNSNRNKVVPQETGSSYYLIPIFIILCVIPLLSHMKIYNTNLSQFAWYSDNDKYIDFYLYYKQWSLIIVTAIMAIACIVKTYKDYSKTKLLPIFIPLTAYAAFVVLSTLFSKYLSFCLAGSFEMFESTFALLSYCIIVYYSYLFLRREDDFKKIFYFILLVVLVIGTIGTFQFFGLDLFSTELGKNILVPENLRSVYNIGTNFPKGVVYSTLYNPNYVGVFVALLVPIIMVMLIFQRKLIPIIIMMITFVELLICVIGSQSLAGFIGLAVSIFLIFVFMWRSLVKRYYIVVPMIIVLIIGFFAINAYRDNYYINKITSSLQGTVTTSDLTDIHTEDNYVSLTYKANELRVMEASDSTQAYTLTAVDADNLPVNLIFDPTTGLFSTTDSRFSGIIMGFDGSYPGAFNILINNYSWLFTKSTEDDTYYYINRFMKLDKIVEAPSVLFKGHESFASGRGYIWSRTIPMLKDYLILGSGPNTYVMAFPQQDYFNLYLNGYGNQILNKPHSMYLQTAVQTGCLSLIAFLIFYGMYFIASFRLYIKGLFNNFYSRLGLGVFIATISYMIVGLASDSTINTAPIFWTLIGVGIVLNMKAKPLIMEELDNIRKMKEEKKASVSQEA